MVKPMQQAIVRIVLRCLVGLIVVACLTLCLFQILTWNMHGVWDDVATMEAGIAAILFAALLEPAFMNEQIRHSLGWFMPPAIRIVCVVAVFLALVMQAVYLLDQHAQPHAFDRSLLLALLIFCGDVVFLGVGIAVLRAAIHLHREARPRQ